jgi:hypothetical protein
MDAGVIVSVLAFIDQFPGVLFETRSKQVGPDMYRHGLFAALLTTLTINRDSCHKGARKYLAS